jgi:hypothetical protein
MNCRVITSFALGPHAVAARPLLLIVFAANLLASAPALKAAVLFSQGSPTGDDPLWISNGPNSGASAINQAETADYFMLPAGGTPSTLQWFGLARLGPPLGSSESFLLRLYSNGPREPNNGPREPGALLYQESIDVIGTDAGRAGRSYSAPFTPGDLAAGTQYFVSVLENDPSTTGDGWRWGQFTIPGSILFQRGGESGPWGPTLGDQALDFTILGSVAPEPGSVILLGIGVLPLAAAKARKRRFRRSL